MTYLKIPPTQPNFHFHLVLVEPQIPPNTGNAGRLCVATQSTLHIVGQAGFSLSDKAVRRAGLDYWKHVDIKEHTDFDAFLVWFKENEPGAPFYLVESDVHGTVFGTKFPSRAALVFGRETTGLPKELLERFSDQVIGLPMFSDKIRSLNLSNAVSITLYEAIRQQLSS